MEIKEIFELMYDHYVLTAIFLAILSTFTPFQSMITINKNKNKNIPVEEIDEAEEEK